MSEFAHRLAVSAALVVSALLADGVGFQLLGFPLIKKTDNIEVWSAGHADFGREQEIGITPHRTARWSTGKPGDCAIRESEIAIRRDGSARFAAKVRSKDEGDHYCVTLAFFDHKRLKLWQSSKICTPFELSDDFTAWIDTSISFPKAYYRFIAFAMREDYC
jgi:hypothetical protein